MASVDISSSGFSPSEPAGSAAFSSLGFFLAAFESGKTLYAAFMIWSTVFGETE
jgi:hypothetical protein